MRYVARLFCLSVQHWLCYQRSWDMQNFCQFFHLQFCRSSDKQGSVSRWARSNNLKFICSKICSEIFIRAILSTYTFLSRSANILNHYVLKKERFPERFKWNIQHFNFQANLYLFLDAPLTILLEFPFYAVSITSEVLNDSRCHLVH